MSENLYLLVIRDPKQQQLIRQHCSGDCGKLSMGGAIDTQDMGLGLCMVCCEDECPYEKGNVDIQRTSEMTGEPVFVRVLEDKS